MAPFPEPDQAFLPQEPSVSNALSSLAPIDLLTLPTADYTMQSSRLPPSGAMLPDFPPV
jgi:hypothetical protein